MKLSQFNFNLPEELIAEYPTERRDESRLMVVNRAEGTISHPLSRVEMLPFDIWALGD